MIEKAIFHRLSNASSITSLTSTRIYNQDLPQETAMPAIVFSRVSTYRGDVAHSGAMGLAEAIIQISIYTEAFSSARSLSEEVRKLFHVYKGTNNGVQVLLSKVIEERDLPYESQLGVYHVAMDIQVKFREATS